MSGVSMEYANDLERVFTEARDLISDPGRWVTVYGAVDELDRACAPTSDEAVRWCGIGAVEWAMRGHLDSDFIRATYDVIENVASEHAGGSITIINDVYGRAEALGCLDDAVVKARELGPESELDYYSVWKVLNGYVR